MSLEFVGGGSFQKESEQSKETREKSGRFHDVGDS